MTYGRLDVFLPDGQFQTYPLSDESISIGRSAGCTIALDTDSLSRYHASLTYKVGEVYLTDLESVNGTFVDGVKLEPNTPYVIYGGEEISIGDVRMIFQSLDDSPTRPILVLEDVTRRLERTELPFYVEIEEPVHSIPPGAHISSTVTISNTGTEPRRFRVEVGGLPEGWARLDRREIEIAPTESGTVVVNFKPRRRSDSAPGDYSVTLTASVVDAPEMKLSGVVIVRVLPFGGFGMALDQDRVRAGMPVRLHLHNQGSAPLGIRLLTRDLGDSLRLKVEPALHKLPPGGRAIAEIRAQPKRTALFGDARQHQFDIVARSGDAASFVVPLRATIDERPLLPGWSAFVFGGLGIALVALIIVGLVVLLRPAPVPPTIDQFTLTGTRIAQGSPLQVQWAATNADTVRILIDGLETERSSETSGSLDINTSLLSGDHHIMLIASNGGEEVQQIQTVTIYTPLYVESFSYSPHPLVLYVAQTLTLDWSVSGAAVTRVSGLESFSTAEEAQYGGGGSLTLAGIATAPITVTLYAEGGDSTLNQTFALDMIAPQCTAQAADVPLRALPDASGQVVATIPRGTTVVVDAQDPFGRWLRVQLSGGARGWGERTALVCADNFSPDDLFKELVAIPPTLAPTLPGTVTVSPVPTLPGAGSGTSAGTQPAPAAQLAPGGSAPPSTPALPTPSG